jgi:hypothetical protein
LKRPAVSEFRCGRKQNRRGVEPLVRGLFLVFTDARFMLDIEFVNHVRRGKIYATTGVGA